jgi:hypothetical protein
VLPYRQVGEEATHLLGSEVDCWAAADESLKPGDPEASKKSK